MKQVNSDKKIIRVVKYDISLKLIYKLESQLSCFRIVFSVLDNIDIFVIIIEVLCDITHVKTIKTIIASVFLKYISTSI